MLLKRQKTYFKKFQSQRTNRKFLPTMILNLSSNQFKRTIYQWHKIHGTQ